MPRRRRQAHGHGAGNGWRTVEGKRPRPGKPRPAYLPASLAMAVSMIPDCGVLVVASAANAGPGLVAAMMKSTLPNASAITMLASTSASLSST